MNARRVHELYRGCWPAFSATECEWVNLLPEPEPDPLRVEQFMRDFIKTPTVLVHVSRQIGGEFELAEGANFLCPYIGSYEIQVAARDLKSLVVIATPGVAAGIITAQAKGVENAG